MGQNLFALTNDLLDPTDPDSTPRAVPVTLCTGDPTTPLVRSGVLESSTVSTVKEMVALLEANRVYEMNSRTLKAQDEMLGRTVSDVGRSVR
jgi:flagellar basal-body rod protein FlgG